MLDNLDRIHVWMKEDELICRIRYHEDRLRILEHEADFHGTALKQARLELDALAQATGIRPYAKVA